MQLKSCPDEIHTELSKLGFSESAISNLAKYVSELSLWSKRINLIGKSTYREIWTRHVLDSAQLVPLISEDIETIFDVGSGAGFPGLVLALIYRWELHLIEPNPKKAAFLNHVSAQLALNTVTVHPCRLEDITAKKADLVVSRAFRNANHLVNLSTPIHKPHTELLLLQGEHQSSQDGDNNLFHVKHFSSMTHPKAFILHLTPKNKAPAA